MVKATILSAFAGSPIETVEATAWPPFLLISLTTSCAGPDVAARAVQRRADVVDDDLGALLGHQKRDGTADTAARAGDDCDFSFDDTRHSSLHVMPGHSRPKDGVASLGHSRPKDGVASLAYGAGHPRLGCTLMTWVAGTSPAMTAEYVG